jgi:hypothetical protein
LELRRIASKIRRSDPSDYPPTHWFAKLEKLGTQPDMLNGIEALVVRNLAYWRGPPNPSEIEMVEKLYTEIGVNGDGDGLSVPRSDDRD